jgi:hypothetical protein
MGRLGHDAGSLKKTKTKKTGKIEERKRTKKMRKEENRKKLLGA